MESNQVSLRERTSRLLGALYREEFRVTAYRCYHRRAKAEQLRRMLGTFLRAEDRMIGLLERHLIDLGAARPQRPGLSRRVIRMLGGGAAWLTSLGGDRAILQRICSEEQRGAEHYGQQAEWDGWSEDERGTLEGHQCDQLYQNKWAGDLRRDLLAGRLRTS